MAKNWILRAGASLAICSALWAWFASPPATPIAFDDIADEAGIDFVLRNSATPERRQIETMVAGVAVFDYNNDERPDIYFVNGSRQPELAKSGPEYWNRLYRNDGGGRFTDVTERAGIEGEGFATGVAAADYDNDGDADLFIAGVNRNILYRNRGDGTFTHVTRQAGLDHRGGGLKPWSIAAGWFDYDNDGDLDLFVVNYVVWIPEKEPFCGDLQRNIRAYCHPKYYEGLPNALYRNNGDSTFTDVSAESGIAAHRGKGMGVAFADYDSDGRMDVLVANDTAPNFLFHNEGGGKFKESALRAGIAFNEDGRALSSMGAEFRDLDNDGRDDIFISALMNETFPVFRNLERAIFADVTYPSAVGKITLAHSGWSNGVFDFNNDGWKDLFVACGDVNDNAEMFSSRSSRQRNLVLANLGGMTFTDVSARAGQDFQRAGLHRGAAFGDFDGDGRVDAVVSRIGERASLFRNVSGARNHWLALRLIGSKSNRDGIGARVIVTGVSGRRQWNHVVTSTGYACSSERVVHFGLGDDARARSIEIAWPSGARQALEDVAADRYLTIREP